MPTKSARRCAIYARIFVTKTLEKLVAGKKGAEVKLGPVVRAAAEYVYSSPPDPEAWAGCAAEFRHLSSAAHPLPWYLNTRCREASY